MSDECVSLWSDFRLVCLLSHSSTKTWYTTRFKKSKYIKRYYYSVQSPINPVTDCKSSAFIFLFSWYPFFFLKQGLSNQLLTLVTQISSSCSCCTKKSFRWLADWKLLMRSSRKSCVSINSHLNATTSFITAQQMRVDLKTGSSEVDKGKIRHFLRYLLWRPF